MSKTDKLFGFIILAFVLLFIGFGIGGACDPGDKYRQGQIDALTGKVKYELKVNPDSTVTWYERGE